MEQQNQVIDAASVKLIKEIENKNIRDIYIEKWLLENDKNKYYDKYAIDRIIELEGLNAIEVQDVNHKYDFSEVNLDPDYLKKKYNLDEESVNRSLQKELKEGKKILPKIKKLCCDEKGVFNDKKFHTNFNTIQSILLEKTITDEQARQCDIDDNLEKNKGKFDRWKNKEPLCMTLIINKNHYITCVIQEDKITVIDPLSDNRNTKYGEWARDNFVARYNAIYKKAPVSKEMFKIVLHNVKTQNDGNSCGPIGVEVNINPTEYMKRRGPFTPEEIKQIRLKHLKILAKDQDLKLGCDICEQIYNGAYDQNKANKADNIYDMLKYINNKIAKYSDNEQLILYKTFSLDELNGVCTASQIKTCKDLQDQLIALSQYKPNANGGIKK